MGIIRKPNRVSRPVRVTQAGTSTSYPHANYAKLTRFRNRWAGETSEHVLTVGAEEGWADGPDPRQVDWSTREQTLPFKVTRGVPRNPFEKTGVRGRGNLGRWGENRADEACVVFYRDGVRYILMVDRKDGRGWAAPGGFANLGEGYVTTAARECLEETGFDPMTRRVRITALVPRYMSKSRKTDYAWIVSVPVVFDLGIIGKNDIPEVRAGDDAARTMWMRADTFEELEFATGGRLFAPHIDVLREVLT